MTSEVADISIRRALAAPLLILAAMAISAVTLALYTGVNGSRVFWPYLSGWGASSLIAAMIWPLVETIRMAFRGEDSPSQKLLAGVWSHYPLLVVPALIFPLFLGFYTWAKSSIPFTVGYPWESFWAHLDHALLGRDGWRIAHAVMPPTLAEAWTGFYAIIWAFALVFSGALLAVFAKRRTIAIFYSAMMLSWFAGGFILAYALSAAGPVFAHLVDPALASRFEPLRSTLVSTLGDDNIVVATQRYLAVGMSGKMAVKGGGVSAMPSMHIATATILVLAGWKSRWRFLSLLFWALTFFGSVYLGYHYAVDAPVAAAVAAICWMLAKKMYEAPAGYLAAGARPDDEMPPIAVTP